MARTALALDRERWQTYRPDSRRHHEEHAEQWERAWQVARQAADLLRRQFGATRVVAFGSLACRDCFTSWSDIDLAAWGISPGAFYRAVAAVTGISSEFKVDLVATEDCQPTLRKAIEDEGVAL